MGRRDLLGADAIFANYQLYLADLPALSAKLRWSPAKLSVIDKTHLIREWLIGAGEITAPS